MRPFGGNIMLVKLFKMAHEADKRGDYAMANEMDEVIKTMAQQVGISLEDLAEVADYLDEVGDTRLANVVDNMIKEGKEKGKYKTFKGKGEKSPKGAEKKAPKGWFDKMKKDIKKKNPDYSAKRINEVIGDIWDNQLTHAKRQRIFKQYGKKTDPDVTSKK
jgi:hypothetical protein